MGSAIKIFRVSNYLHMKKVPLLPGFLVWLNRLLFSIDLPASVHMGKGVYLGHNGLACVIHKRAVIGENTKIYQNVTIGWQGQSGCPTIEKIFLLAAAPASLAGSPSGITPISVQTLSW